MLWILESMTMKIIKPREYHQETYYRLFFEYVDLQGAGFIFDCDENGNVFDNNPQESYRKCLSGEHKVKSGQVMLFKNRTIIPAIGECNCCGCEVELVGFTNTCQTCGTDYNGSGQQLADRSQWAEETQEYLEDILRIR